MKEVKCRFIDKCIQDKRLCHKCTFNESLPKLASYLKFYEPVCPKGYNDCVLDPAYIKYYYPDWYKDLYGNKTPVEVALEECGGKALHDDCYDDEDK